MRDTKFYSAAILDYWLPVSSGSVTDSTIEKFDPKNMEVAVGMFYLASLQAGILLGVVLALLPSTLKWVK